MIYYLGLGTNLGDKEQNLHNSILLLSEKVEILQESIIYHSQPMGPQDQDEFLNMVIAVDTDLEPLQLLRLVKDIEKTIGREKSERWGPRVIDIDILLIKNQSESLSLAGKLDVPHLGLLEREFALKPLEEIAPGQIKKFFGKSYAEILKKVKYRI